MQMVASSEKAHLREILLEKLLALTKEEAKRRSQNVQKTLSNIQEYKQAKTIMVYYPLKGEVDILEMIRKELGSKRFCFPLINMQENQIVPFEITDLEKDFSRGPFGIKQPDPEKTKKLDIKEIDLVIVPALAYDRQKNRLGRGGGFYDRFLKTIKSPAKKVGVAFQFQILENLPIHLPFDEKVDIVASEDFLI